MNRVKSLNRYRNLPKNLKNLKSFKRKAKVFQIIKKFCIPWIFNKPKHIIAHLTMEHFPYIKKPNKK